MSGEKNSPCPSFLNDIQLIRKGKDDMLSPMNSTVQQQVAEQQC